MMWFLTELTLGRVYLLLDMLGRGLWDQSERPHLHLGCGAG